MRIIRMPYTALEHAQRRISGSKIEFQRQEQVFCLRLQDGRLLNIDQAAELAGINYVPYVWHETRPGGAIYHE